jgi:hypothetical protein
MRVRVRDAIRGLLSLREPVVPPMTLSHHYIEKTVKIGLDGMRRNGRMIM